MDPMNRELPRVRLTGILLEDDRILLVKETLRERSRWNLPGGAPLRRARPSRRACAASCGRRRALRCR